MGRTNLILDNLLAAGKVKPMIVVSETSMHVPGGGRGAGRWSRALRPGAGARRPRNWPRRCAGTPGAAPAPGAGRGGGFGGGPGGGAYGQLMINDLIPWVDSHFRTLADKDHRAMGGPFHGRRKSPRPSPWSTSISSPTSGCSAAAAQPASAAAAAVAAPRQAQLRRAPARAAPAHARPQDRL